VFVDGCFWHGCPDHGGTPRANRDWWVNKIATNQRRDNDTDDQLRALGWTVVRVWEHDDPGQAAEKIESIVRRPRS
jgi:DNA mismatch endonuclease (patch repair protein)